MGLQAERLAIVNLPATDLDGGLPHAEHPAPDVMWSNLATLLHVRGIHTVLRSFDPRDSTATFSMLRERYGDRWDSLWETTPVFQQMMRETLIRSLMIEKDGTLRMEYLSEQSPEGSNIAVSTAGIEFTQKQAEEKTDLTLFSPQAWANALDNKELILHANHPRQTLSVGSRREEITEWSQRPLHVLPVGFQRIEVRDRVIIDRIDHEGTQHIPTHLIFSIEQRSKEEEPLAQVGISNHVIVSCDQPGYYHINTLIGGRVTSEWKSRNGKNQRTNIAIGTMVESEPYQIGIANASHLSVATCYPISYQQFHRPSAFWEIPLTDDSSIHIGHLVQPGFSARSEQWPVSVSHQKYVTSDSNITREEITPLTPSMKGIVRIDAVHDMTGAVTATDLVCTLHERTPDGTEDPGQYMTSVVVNGPDETTVAFAEAAATGTSWGRTVHTGERLDHPVEVGRTFDTLAGGRITLHYLDKGLILARTEAGKNLVVFSVGLDMRLNVADVLRLIHDTAAKELEPDTQPTKGSVGWVSEPDIQEFGQKLSDMARADQVTQGKAMVMYRADLLPQDLAQRLANNPTFADYYELKQHRQPPTA